METSTARKQEAPLEQTLPSLGTSIKELLSLIAITAAAGFLGKTYQLLDQAFAARLSAEHLAAHVFTSYVHFFFFRFSIVLGIGLIILLGKSTANSDRSTYLTGASIVSLLVSSFVAGAAILFFFVGPIDPKIMQVDGASAYFSLLTLAAIPLSLNTVFKYAAIANRTPKVFLLAEIIGTSINAAGNYIAVQTLPTVAMKFSGIAATTLVVQIVLSLYYFRRFGPELMWKFSALADFWRRAKKLLAQESSNTALEVAAPILLTLLYSTFGGISLMNAYNVGLAMTDFFAVPMYALILMGTAWLAPAWQSGIQGAIKLKLRSIRILSIALVIAPVVAMIAVMPGILRIGFNITDDLAVTTARLSLLGLIPLAFAIPSIAAIRNAENPKLLSYGQLMAVYLIGMPAFYILNANGFSKLAILASVAVPQVIQASAYVVFLSMVLKQKMKEVLV